MHGTRLLCLAFILSGAGLRAAESRLLAPLAHSSLVPCSEHPGIRAVRSNVVEFGTISASIASQASHEGRACVQSAALSVTQKDVTQQFELPNPAKTRFAIVDIAPDSSEILLTSERDRQARIAVVSLATGSFEWLTLSGIIRPGCDSTLEAQGFLDAGHVVLADLPSARGHNSKTCPQSAAFYSVEVESHRLKILNTERFIRTAKVVSGAMQTCRTDPDVVRACYSARARLGVSPNGQGMQLWTFGSNHLSSVEYGMVPASLISALTPETRVLATMVICPMALAPRAGRQVVCIDSAANIRPEAARKSPNQ